MATTENTSSGFLDPPPEIRRMVYDQLVRIYCFWGPPTFVNRLNRKQKRTMFKWTTEWLERLRLPGPLPRWPMTMARTCKTIRTELLHHLLVHLKVSYIHHSWYRTTGSPIPSPMKIQVSLLTRVEIAHPVRLNFIPPFGEFMMYTQWCIHFVEFSIRFYRGWHARVPGFTEGLLSLWDNIKTAVPIKLSVDGCSVNMAHNLQEHEAIRVVKVQAQPSDTEKAHLTEMQIKLESMEIQGKERFDVAYATWWDAGSPWPSDVFEV
ncbi:F-box protein [Sphaceloma murrayae]|uniref:F-box protein n=1 Tax=Sphaceloma murrayae TaxID=2082308 RepID=A0A2K1QXD0_9PEZI|nr:F-box protein [Sphaceloma murrayae]